MYLLDFLVLYMILRNCGFFQLVKAGSCLNGKKTNSRKMDLGAYCGGF
jgi:hypothetical protein